MSTKVTATGVKSVLSASAIKQLEGASELCRMIMRVPHFQKEAGDAAVAIVALIEARPTE